MALKEYIDKVYNETRQIKRISIEVRGWTPTKNGEYDLAVRQVEGDSAEEFFRDYESKFGMALDQNMKQSFLKLFAAAIERQKTEGGEKAEIDAMVKPKDMKREDAERIIGRNQPIH